MNVSCIGPFELTTDYKDLIEHLAVRWTVANLPLSIPYLYLDHWQAIGMLLTTQSAKRIRLIFTGVLNQTVALSRSSRMLGRTICILLIDKIY